jgi:predicted house-cleaning noncanonical NTP pyrophosphatase (MazG superfamily)
MRYGKLVRDNIPNIIEASGQKAITHVAEDQEFEQALRNKFVEEAEEFRQSGSIDELADALEVMSALVQIKGFTWQQLRDARTKKFLERGGFHGRIILEETK